MLLLLFYVSIITIFILDDFFYFVITKGGAMRSGRLVRYSDCHSVILITGLLQK